MTRNDQKRMGRVESRLRRARLRLYDDVPFFGHLVDHVTLHESDRVPTAAIEPDGTVHYDPEFVDGLTDPQLRALLSHEVMHVAMRGHERLGDREGDLWNMAQDAIINHHLVQAGFDLPECGIIPDDDGSLIIAGVEFDDLDRESFETVYGKLAANQVDPDAVDGFDAHVVRLEDGEDENDESGATTESNPDTVPEVDTDGKDWEEIVDRAKAAASVDEQGGTAPGDGAGNGGLTVHASEPGMVDYRRYIKQKIGSAIPADYTYRRPNKRSRATGTYLPSIEREHESVTIAVVLDTSGSITRDHLQQFAAEIGAITAEFDRIQLVLVQHDDAVQAVDTYEEPSAADFGEVEITGRGGTDHRPPLNRLAEDDLPVPDLVVAYTDGYSEFPDTPPVAEATHLWVLTASSGVSSRGLPFGATSRLSH